MVPFFDLACEIAFDPEPGAAYLRAQFSILGTAGDDYFYADMSNVTDYVVQAGDYLEYDIYWEGPPASFADQVLAAVDLTCSDATDLRSSSAVDQNGFAASPATDLPPAYGAWYSRQIALPATWIGKTISYWDLACEYEAATGQTRVVVARFRDIRITDGYGMIRKNAWRQVYPANEFGYETHRFSSGSSVSISKTYETPEWSDVTDDLFEAECKQGRDANILAQADAGTGMLVLDNRHRRYDPSNVGEIANQIPNPSFEQTIGDWLSGGGGVTPTPSRRTNGGRRGPCCMRLVSGVAAGVSSMYIRYPRSSDVAQGYFPVTPGQTVYARGSMKRVSGGGTSLNFRLDVEFKQADGTDLGGLLAQNRLNPTLGTWHDLSGSVTAPANSAYCRIVPNVQAIQNGENVTVDFDGFQIVVAADPAAGYIDGDMENGGWQDAPNASPSTWGAPYAGKIEPNRLVRIRIRRYHDLVVAEHAPASLWRLADAVGAASVDDNVGGYDAAVTGATLGAAALLTGEDETTASFDGNDYLSVAAPYDFPGQAPFSVEAWVYPTTLDATDRGIIACDYNDGSAQGWSLTVRDNQFKFIRTRDGTSDVASSSGVVDPAINTRYHVVATYDGTTMRLYVDGQWVDDQASSRQIKAGASSFQIGRAAGVYFVGRIAEAAVYERALSAVQVKANYDKGVFAHYGNLAVLQVADFEPEYMGRGSEVTLPLTDAFAALAEAEILKYRAAELSGARINWVLDQISWAGGRDIDVGNTTVQELSDVAGTLAQPAIGHIQDVAQAELGLCFIDHDGAVAFHDRRRRIPDVDESVAATYSDEPTGNEFLYIDIAPSLGGDAIRNEIRTRAEGTTTDQVAEDLDSQARYGKRTESRQVFVQTVGEALAQSQYLVSQTRSPRIHFDSLVIDPKRDWQRLLPELLAREISDRILVKWTPPGGGATAEVESYIESREHRITTRDGRWQWLVGWQLTPADVQNYWVLGDSERSLLGETTLLGY